MNTVPPRPTKPGKDQDTSTEAKISQLLREGIAAAKLGDKETARSRLQQVVSLDPRNEQGWFWLASVVESSEERRACLEKVIAISPRNQRAQAMLDQLTRPASSTPGRLQTLPKPDANSEAEAASGSADNMLSSLRDPLAAYDPSVALDGSAEAQYPGGTSPEMAEQKRRRRYSILLLGGLAVVIVAVAGALILSNNTPAPPPTPASLLQSLTETAIQAPSRQAVQPATGAGLAAGTGEATVVTQTPAPTFTALPSPTKSGVLTGTPMAAPPAGLPGHLLAVSGGYIGAKDINLPLFLIDPADWKLRPVLPGERGEYLVLLPDGQRVLYSRLVSGMNTQQLRIVNLDGRRAIDANSLWGNQPPLAEQRMVAIARNGRGMVLAAANIVESDNTPDIYYARVNLTAPSSGATDAATTTLPLTVTSSHPTARPGRAFTRTPTQVITPTPAETATPEPIQAHRLTLKDSGYHSWPSISPDGRMVVFANDSNPTSLEGTHIYSVPVEGGAPKDLTSDMDALGETEPEWSPDGTKIVFRAVPKDSPPDTISYIYVMNADGSEKRPLVNDVYNNIRPHWSPDGKYVAFSSTRNGKWEIYIVEVASGTIYQVTQTDKVTLCTSWGS